MYYPGIENNDSVATSSVELGERVQECIFAAKKALEAVDDMASDSTLFHSLWWTSYVTFCALTVVYVWAIQRRKGGGGYGGVPCFDIDCDQTGLTELAERCYGHLAHVTAEDSPSRRYSLILEELRMEARRDVRRTQPTRHGHLRHVQCEAAVYDGGDRSMVETEQVLDGGYLDSVNGEPDATMCSHKGGRTQADNETQIPTLFDEWQTTDWLDLDSLVRVSPC
jgi:hypothetical protein